MTDKPNLPARPQRRKLVTQPAGALDTRRRKGGLTRRVRIAVDAMMFDRCTRDEACKRAGFTERALYLALAKAEVAAYWNEQLQVLRTGARARNFQRLEELRDQDGNRAAAVKAIQVLEAVEDEPVARSRIQTPGIIIIVGADKGETPPMVIDAKPTTEK